jgi:hypothetical protein
LLLKVSVVLSLVISSTVVHAGADDPNRALYKAGRDAYLLGNCEETILYFMKYIEYNKSKRADYEAFFSKIDEAIANCRAKVAKTRKDLLETSDFIGRGHHSGSLSYEISSEDLDAMNYAIGTEIEAGRLFEPDEVFQHIEKNESNAK